MGKIRVIKAKEKDIPQMEEIERDSFSDMHGISIKNNYPIVAKIGDKVVGYAISAQMWGNLHILDIAVRPTHKGKGIGKALLSKLISYAREHKIPEVYLEVKASNVRAIKLYAKNGFKIKAGYKFPWKPDIIYNMTLYLK